MNAKLIVASTRRTRALRIDGLEALPLSYHTDGTVSIIVRHPDGSLSGEYALRQDSLILEGAVEDTDERATPHG